MKGLKEIYELLEDASTVIMTFQNAFTIIEQEPFYTLKMNDDRAGFFIDSAFDLVKKYNIKASISSSEIQEAEISTHIAIGWIKTTGEKAKNMLEDLFFQLDKECRLAATRKIIRSAEYILSLDDAEFEFIKYACLCVSYGSRERYIEVDGKGKLSIDELLNLTTSLVVVSAQLLYQLSTNCIDFEIGEIEIFVKQIFPDKYETMNMDFFDKKAQITSTFPLFNYDSVSKIYNKCDGKQWVHISEKNFMILLNSNGKDQSLNIKKREINRTKCIFKILANYIKDIDKRKIWIEGITKNIFNDVDFMRATLRTDKSRYDYSSIDAIFQESIDKL